MEKSYECIFCSSIFKNGLSLGGHKVNCKMNPSLKNTRIKQKNVATGRIMDDITRGQISQSMKKAHLENRAWNIGRSRWNNEPSYPEKFIMKAIENENIDGSYIREYPFGRYSIDFAWAEKKKALEIDGEQHARFSEYLERDIKKDELLKLNGWKVMRVQWVDIFNDPKNRIQEIKNFIMGG